MRKTIKYVAMAAAIIFSVQSVEAQSFKDKMKSKLEKTYEFEDETGISGHYFTNDQIIDRQNAIGFEFTKEEDGTIVNKLYVELGGKGYGNRPNSLTFTLKEKYKTKHGFNYFYITDKDCPNLANNHDLFTFIEIGESVYAFAQEEKVLCVAAKDKAKFEEFDTETAQVLFDQKMALINTEAIDKQRKKLMGFAAYKAYTGKMAFSSKLNTFNYRSNEQPTEDPKNFKKELIIGEQGYWRAYLNKPLSISHPGAWFNISYELNGITTDREELRKKNSYYSKNIPRKDSGKQYFVTYVMSMIEKQNGFDVWDIAFIDLLYQNKDKFEIGKSYELTVRLKAYKDGENIEDLAVGKVNLKYTEESKKLMSNNDPYKLGIIQKYEKQIDE